MHVQEYVCKEEKKIEKMGPIWDLKINIFEEKKKMKFGKKMVQSFFSRGLTNESPNMYKSVPPNTNAVPSQCMSVNGFWK